jgi:riboflavin transporter FmnP
MFKKINWPRTLISGSLAGILFCIPVYFFIKDATYQESWLFYVGSFFFLIVIAAHTLVENKLRGQNESTVALVFASHVATIVGVIVAIILCFFLLVIFVPGYLSAGNTAKTLINEPSNTILDKTNGLSFKVFMCATILNFSAGSFASIIFPFAAKKNQTKDSREPTPLQQKKSE